MTCTCKRILHSTFDHEWRSSVVKVYISYLECFLERQYFRLLNCYTSCSCKIISILSSIVFLLENKTTSVSVISYNVISTSTHL